MLRRLRPVLLLTAAIACAGSQDAVHQWAVDTIPVVDIAATGPGGEPVLASVVGATRLADGTVIVADAYDAAIRFFDRGGRLMRSVGRHGGGPGEFTSLAWLGQCGRDSVYAWDRGRQLMSVLTATGAVVREFHIAPTPTLLACAPNGTFAFFGPAEDLPTSVTGMEEAQLHGPLFVAAHPDSTVKSLGVAPMGEPRPLGRMTQLATSRDYAFVGPADSGTVIGHPLRGGADVMIRTGVASRVATARHFDRAIAAQAAVFSDAASRAMTERMLHQMKMPARLPAYSGLFADPTGVLWVELSIPGDSGTWLRGVDPTGRIVADLHLPREVRVFEVGADYLLGSVETPSGELHVNEYHWQRGR